MPLLLISGQPGAGKSTFCRWLAEEHGYIHVETDVDWGTWGPFLTAEDLASARQVRNKIRGLGPDVAFEWGFSPELLPRVRQLSMMGLQKWWFRADEPRARLQYEEREGDVSMTAYVVQSAKIVEHWPRIATTYKDRILDVLNADGTRMAQEEIYDRITS